ARTGYTGEDGFEISISANDAEAVWGALSGAPGVARCGLAARDSLRLEAGMRLYGNDLSDRSTPFDVRMGRLVNLDHDLVRRYVLRRRAEAVVAALIGLTGDGRRAARAGSQVFVEGAQVGDITAGTLSPTLGYPLAMSLVEHVLEEGQDFEVYVR